MKRFLFVPLLLATPLWASTNDDNVRQVYLFNLGIIQELAKDYAPGQASKEGLLPGQKNTPLKIKIVTKKSQQEEKAPDPVKHDFTAKTVWANLTVHVTDFHGHFNVAVESDTPIDGWVIKRISSQAVVSKGGENSAFNFAFDVQENFNDDYSLTVMANKDGMTNPALVPLRNGGGS